MLHLDVYESDGNNDDDLARTITDLVIPFNNIVASNTWTSKQSTFANHSGYLEIEIKISCDLHFGGLGCNYCLIYYYTTSCNKYCNPVEGNYTCNSEGDRRCAEHKTGENCDICEFGWTSQQCQQCSEYVYPSGVCNVLCIPVYGIYSCSEEGTKVCLDITPNPDNECIEDSATRDFESIAIEATVIAVISLALVLALLKVVI